MNRKNFILCLIFCCLPALIHSYSVEIDDFEGGTYTADAYDPQLGVTDQWVDTDGDGFTDLQTGLTATADDGILTVSRVIPLHYPGTNASYAAINRVYHSLDNYLDISGTAYISFLIKDEFVYYTNAGPTNTDNNLSFKLYTEDAVWQSISVKVPQDGEWHQVVLDISSLVNIKNYKPEISMDKIAGYSLRFTKSGNCRIKDMQTVSFFEETFPRTNGTLMTNSEAVRLFLNIPFQETNLAPLIDVSNLTTGSEVVFQYDYNTNYQYLELRCTNHSFQNGDQLQIKFSPTITMSAEGLPYFPVNERFFSFYYGITNADNIAISNVGLSGDLLDIVSLSADDTRLFIEANTVVLDEPLNVVWFSPSNTTGIMLSNRMGLFKPEYDADFGLYRFEVTLAGDYVLTVPGEETEPFSFQLEQNPFTPNNDGYGDDMTAIIRIAEEGELVVTVTDSRGREITELFDDDVDAGDIRLTWDGDDCPAGVYFLVVKMRIGSRLYRDAGAVVLCE